MQWHTVPDDRTSHTKCPVAELYPCSGYDQINTSSRTESRKVGNSGNRSDQLLNNVDAVNDYFAGITYRPEIVNCSIPSYGVVSSNNDPLVDDYTCLLYTSPSPRDRQKSRMPSSA